MPYLPHSSPDHDETLIARLAVDDLADRRARRPARPRLVADCPACAELLADLRAIAAATAALPAPRRTRDFRLTEADAARLRPPAGAALVARFGSPTLRLHPAARGRAGHARDRRPPAGLAPDRLRGSRLVDAGAVLRSGRRERDRIGSSSAAQDAAGGHAYGRRPAPAIAPPADRDRSGRGRCPGAGGSGRAAVRSDGGRARRLRGRRGHAGWRPRGRRPAPSRPAPTDSAAGRVTTQAAGGAVAGGPSPLVDRLGRPARRRARPRVAAVGRSPARLTDGPSASRAGARRVHSTGPHRPPPRLADGTPDAARRQQAHLPRILRAPAPDDRQGRARQRRLRLLRASSCAASRTSSRTTSRSAFDLSGPTFRHERYADYKATRPRMPDDLRDQFPKVREVVKALRIPVYELAGYEADDVIGTLTRPGRGATGSRRRSSPATSTCSSWSPTGPG